MLTEADYAIGIWKLIDAWDWETMVGKTLNDKKGELRKCFCVSFKRGQTDAVVNFALRYRTLVSEMRSEGIQLDDAESAGFFKQRLC